MKMTLKKLFLRSVLILAVSGHAAGDIIYDVMIDTSSVAGFDGALYLQFNPGIGVASVTISPFSAGSGSLLTAEPLGALAPGGGTGDFSGGLNPPPLTLVNTDAVNDYLQYLTFGDAISFTASFNVPSGASAVFSFATTASDGLTPILVADPDLYYLGHIELDEQGVTVTNNSPGVATIATPVPEPGGFVMILVAVSTLLALRRRRS